MPTEDATSRVGRLATAARALQPAGPSPGQHPAEASGHDVYRAAADTALENIDGAEAAGLFLVKGRGGRIRALGATRNEVELVAQAQDDLSEGPCLEAAWDYPVVHSPDLADEPRFPRWAARVITETGFRSAVSFRLFTLNQTLGSLCVYSTQPHAFTASSIEDGTALAAHIALAIANAENIEGLRVALDTRALIGQATGLLMERYGVSASAAFEALTRLASANETKVRDLAAEIVETGHVSGLPDR